VALDWSELSVRVLLEQRADWQVPRARESEHRGQGRLACGRLDARQIGLRKRRDPGQLVERLAALLAEPPDPGREA
jgi:hypothetical protein